MEACGPTAPPTADPKPPLAQSNQPIYKNHASRWCTLIRPKVVHFEVIGDTYWAGRTLEFSMTPPPAAIPWAKSTPPTERQ
jgi:hypothetical protein